MIGAAKHSKKQDIPTINIVDCPACGKHRLRKYVNQDGSVDAPSQQTVEVRDEERYLEVCEPCIARYRRSDDKFVKENLKKLSKAFNESDLPEGESDHKDFSLN